MREKKKEKAMNTAERQQSLINAVTGGNEMAALNIYKMKLYRVRALIVTDGRNVRFSLWANTLAEAREKAHEKLERRKITNYLLFVI
jgi:hypothetical protein